jgi:hypothetical protein
LFVLPLSADCPVPAPAASAATNSEASSEEFSERRAGEASDTFEPLPLPLATLMPKVDFALAEFGARGSEADADEDEDEALAGAVRACCALDSASCAGDMGGAADRWLMLVPPPPPPPPEGDGGIAARWPCGAVEVTSSGGGGACADEKGRDMCEGGCGTTTTKKTAGPAHIEMAKTKKNTTAQRKRMRLVDGEKIRREGGLRYMWHVRSLAYTEWSD